MHNPENEEIYQLYQFTVKDSEIKDYTVFLGNISKDLTINNMKETWLKGTVNSQRH